MHVVLKTPLTPTTYPKFKMVRIENLLEIPWVLKGTTFYLRANSREPAEYRHFLNRGTDGTAAAKRKEQFPEGNNPNLPLLPLQNENRKEEAVPNNSSLNVKGYSLIIISHHYPK